MTDINGPRLAYRGFIAGLAGGYVWAAIAMVLAWIVRGDPLLALAPLADALMPIAGSRELALVLGLAAAQGAGGLIGMCFAYFFGRYFTVRATLAIAAPAFTLLVWGLIAAGIPGHVLDLGFITHPIPIVAAVGYGLLLGAAVPLRGEVTRRELALGAPSA